MVHLHLKMFAGNCADESSIVNRRTELSMLAPVYDAYVLHDSNYVA